MNELMEGVCGGARETQEKSEWRERELERLTLDRGED